MSACTALCDVIKQVNKGQMRKNLNRKDKSASLRGCLWAILSAPLLAFPFGPHRLDFRLWNRN